MKRYSNQVPPDLLEAAERWRRSLGRIENWKERPPEYALDQRGPCPGDYWAMWPGAIKKEIPRVGRIDFSNPEELRFWKEMRFVMARPEHNWTCYQPRTCSHRICAAAPGTCSRLHQHCHEIRRDSFTYCPDPRLGLFLKYVDHYPSAWAHLGPLRNGLGRPPDVMHRCPPSVIAMGFPYKSKACTQSWKVEGSHRTCVSSGKGSVLCLPPLRDSKEHPYFGWVNPEYGIRAPPLEVGHFTPPVAWIPVTSLWPPDVRSPRDAKLRPIREPPIEAGRCHNFSISELRDLAIVLWKEYATIKNCTILAYSEIDRGHLANFEDFDWIREWAEVLHDDGFRWSRPSSLSRPITDSNRTRGRSSEETPSSVSPNPQGSSREVKPAVPVDEVEKSEAGVPPAILPDQARSSGDSAGATREIETRGRTCGGPKAPTRTPGASLPPEREGSRRTTRSKRRHRSSSVHSERAPLQRRRRTLRAVAGEPLWYPVGLNLVSKGRLSLLREEAFGDASTLRCLGITGVLFCMIPSRIELKRLEELRIDYFVCRPSPILEAFLHGVKQGAIAPPASRAAKDLDPGLGWVAQHLLRGGHVAECCTTCLYKSKATALYHLLHLTGDTTEGCVRLLEKARPSKKGCDLFSHFAFFIEEIYRWKIADQMQHFRKQSEYMGMELFPEQTMKKHYARIRLLSLAFPLYEKSPANLGPGDVEHSSVDFRAVFKGLRSVDSGEKRVSDHQGAASSGDAPVEKPRKSALKEMILRRDTECRTLSRISFAVEESLTDGDPEGVAAGILIYFFSTYKFLWVGAGQEFPPTLCWDRVRILSDRIGKKPKGWRWFAKMSVLPEPAGCRDRESKRYRPPAVLKDSWDEPSDGEAVNPAERWRRSRMTISGEKSATDRAAREWECQLGVHGIRPTATNTAPKKALCVLGALQAIHRTRKEFSREIRGLRPSLSPEADSLTDDDSRRYRWCLKNVFGLVPEMKGENIHKPGESSYASEANRIARVFVYCMNRRWDSSFAECVDYHVDQNYQRLKRGVKTDDGSVSGDSLATLTHVSPDESPERAGDGRSSSSTPGATTGEVLARPVSSYSDGPSLKRSKTEGTVPVPGSSAEALSSEASSTPERSLLEEFHDCSSNSSMSGKVTGTTTPQKKN